MPHTKQHILRRGLTQVLCLAWACSFSLYLASPSAQAQGPYTGQPVSLKVVQISVTDFFRTISELSGLNILIDPEVGGSLTLNVEQVPWDQLFDAVLQSQGLAKRIEGNLVRISTQDKLRAEQEINQSLKEATFLAADTLTVTKRLNYATGSEIRGTLEPHLTPRGSMNVDDRTNTLIISDVPYGIDAVTSLIKILDVAEKQVEIEARIIEASTNFSRSLGVQLGFGIGRIEPPKNAFGDVADRVTSQINTITPASGQITGIAGLMVGGLVDVFRLDALISAAETDGEARILSKPRVTTQNNTEAIITQGSEIPIPVQQNFTTTVQFQTAALQLTVIPRVTNVGTILLNIHVENNVPDFARTVLGIPAIQTSEATTQVMVQDGGTTVIGGIYVQSESETEDRVPGLGRIPLLGNLFKSNTKSKDTREIIFFITARIQK
ncbi:MAG: type IV pilus secretin PilQ [Acidobacteria bacterium]|nr:MAG: type IV pilus secretin PilQ [Acidobacteriota bacterium]